MSKPHHTSLVALLLSPITLPIKAIFFVLCVVSGADYGLARHCPFEERWRIGRNGCLVLLGFGLNAVGFESLLERGLDGTGEQALWAIVIGLSGLFAIMNASSIADGIKHAGRQIVSAKWRGETNFTHDPLPVPIYRMLISGVVFVFVALALVFRVLHSDVSAMMHYNDKRLNAPARQEATTYLNDRKKIATSKRDREQRLVDSLSELDRSTDRMSAHPQLLALFVARDRLATVKSEIINDTAEVADSERRVSCEKNGPISGTVEKGCSGKPGDGRRSRRNQEANDQAKRNLVDALKEKGELDSNIKTLEGTVASLMKAALSNRDAAQKEVDELEADSQGDKFESLVQAQPSYQVVGSSLTAEGDALGDLALAKPTAAFVVIGLILMLVLFDLGPMQIGRDGSNMSVYAEAAFLADDVALEKLATTFLEESTPYAERRDELEQIITELRKRRRHRTFEEAVAEATATANMAHVSNFEDARNARRTQNSQRRTV